MREMRARTHTHTNDTHKERTKRTADEGRCRVLLVETEGVWEQGRERVRERERERERAHKSAREQRKTHRRGGARHDPPGEPHLQPSREGVGRGDGGVSVGGRRGRKRKAKGFW